MKAVFITCEDASGGTASAVVHYSDIRICESLESICASPHGPKKFINLSLRVTAVQNRACPLTGILLVRLMKFSLKCFCALRRIFQPRCFSYFTKYNETTEE